AQPAQVSAHPLVELTIRPQVSVPEVSHRELPQCPTAEIVGQAHRLPVPPADSARSDPDWPSLAQQKRVERAATARFQIIGVLNKLYVLMENVDGLVLVDQHAAHERILFEELRRRMEEQGVPSQKLLITQTFELPPRDADWIEQNMLRYLEVEKLIQDLLECDLPYCCPHGRPTMIQISNVELEKKFGRKV